MDESNQQIIDHEDYFCCLLLINSTNELNFTTDEAEEIEGVNTDQLLHPFSVSLITSFNIGSTTNSLSDAQE